MWAAFHPLCRMGDSTVFHQPDAAAAVRRRIIIFQSTRYCGDLGLRLLASHAWFEKNETFNPTRAAIFQFVSANVEDFLH